ncbi:hypothetical protein ACFXA3_38510 [Streptomyces sp. NPDC059456]|uniref:hypothetical protein n=1 Tax=Streptomyces sp. NPDC059456 TaxID=3346838 RepID=UPI0036B22525
MTTMPARAGGPKVPPSYPPRTPPPQKKPVEAPRPRPATKPAARTPLPGARVRGRAAAS